MIYLALYVIMVVTHIPVDRLDKQSNALLTNLATRGGTTVTDQTPMQFYNIQTLEDFWDWFEKTLIPAFYMRKDIAGNELEKDNLGHIALFNRVVGAVLLSTLSSKKKNCLNQEFLNELYPNCHDRENPIYDYKYVDPLDEGDIIRAVEEVKNQSWISNDTMEAEIKILTYNGEIDSYGVTTLNLEFEEGGFIDLSVNTIACKASTYSSSQAYVVDSLVLTCLVLVIGRQLRDLYRNRSQLAAHIMNFWVVIDYASTVLVLVFYVLWGCIVSTTNESTFKSTVKALASNTDWYSDNNNYDDDLTSAFTTLRSIANLTVALQLISTITILLLGIRILGRFHLHPRLNVLSQTIAGSLSKFSAFSVVCTIVVVMFAMAGHVIFGDRAKEFSTVVEALKSCVNILFGNFDYSSIDGLHGPVSIIYCWTYTVVATLILLNMTLAIVLATYEDVSEQAFKDTTITSLRRMSSIVVYNVLLWFHNIRGGICCRKGSRRLSRMASLQEDGSSDLVRRDVVFLGRIRPDVLESALTRLVFPDGGEHQTQASIELTLESLQRMFSRAEVSDSEARATIKYLKDGLMSEKSGEGDEGGDDRVKQSLLRSLTHRRSGHRQSETVVVALRSSNSVSEIAEEATTKQELKKLQNKIGALELKLNLILDHLGTAQSV